MNSCHSNIQLDSLSDVSTTVWNCDSTGSFRVVAEHLNPVDDRSSCLKFLITSAPLTGSIDILPLSAPSINLSVPY